MKRLVILCSGILVLAATLACAPTWKHTGGAVALSPAYFYPKVEMEAGMLESESRSVSFTLPDGWHWYRRGSDFIATRDGVFLQQILVERLHLDQVDQKIGGAASVGAWSTFAWPVRTAKSLTKRFVAGMPPADASEVLLDSRGNDPSVTGLEVRELVTRTVAGQPAFSAVFDFRLKSTVVDPSPLYRSTYSGFVLGDWFYGISYTATTRYYFDRDAGAFETFLDSVRLADQ